MSDVLEQEPITYLERGTRMWVELGTPDAPELVQWTSWLPHPWMTSFVRYHQSYAVLSNQGAVLIDPWEPVESIRSIAAKLEKNGYSDGEIREKLLELGFSSKTLKRL